MSSLCLFHHGSHWKSGQPSRSQDPLCLCCTSGKDLPGVCVVLGVTVPL